MRKIIAVLSIISCVILLSVSVFADPLSVEAVFDQEGCPENTGRLTVTVTNNLESDFMDETNLKLELPESITAVSPESAIGVLPNGEKSVTEFMLTFPKLSFFDLYKTYFLIGGAVTAAAVLVIIFAKAGKKAKKSVTSAVLAFTFLCGAFAVTSSAEDTAKPESDKTEAYYANQSVEVKNLTKTYTVGIIATAVPAVPAVSHPIKGDRESDKYGEYNQRKVNQKKIVEGAGPLTKMEVYIGKNDFMFLGETIPDYTGENLLSPASLKHVGRIFNERGKWCEENGIKLYFLICPNKATVYPEYVPDSLTPTEYTRRQQIVDYINENTSVTVIDPTEAIINAKTEYGDTLYHKYDTHWTQNAGFVAYTEIMKTISKDFPDVVTYPKNYFNVTNYETYMKDMPYYLGYYDKYYDESPVYSLKIGPEAVLTNFVTNEGTGQYIFCYEWENGYRDDATYCSFESRNTEAPTAYFLRDSYSIQLIPFLKESFSKSTFNWTRKFSKSQLLASGTDMIIIECAEKYFQQILDSRTISE